MEVFYISIESDSPDIHPQFFCHSCKIVQHKASSAVKQYQHMTVVFEGWCTHAEDSCQVCEHYHLLQRRGRPKKVKRTAGQPPTISPRYCVDHIREIVPPTLAPLAEVDVCTHHNQGALTELTCLICCGVLDSPVEIVRCQSVVCVECLCSWLQHSNDLAFPCRCDHHLREYSTGIRSASTLILHLLRSLCVICGRCQSHVQLDAHNDHVKSGCTTRTRRVSSNSSVEDVLRRPLTSPLTPVEQKLQTSLARRSMSGSPEDVLQMKTGGRVCTYSCIMHTCLDVNYVHTITANDLCTGESGISAIRKGGPTNHPEKVTFPGKCLFCCQCWG